MKAEAIAKALGGRKVGNNWMARCPAHNDRDPSLGIRDTPDGRVLVRCHAGCDQARVIGALRMRGLWDNKGGRRSDSILQQPRRSESDQSDSDNKRAIAMNIWRCTTSGTGTLVETYLRSRALTVQPPPILRFHAGLKHPSGDVWPAMIALVTRGADNAFLAIHRTFLSRSGTGKAPTEPQKMMLGPCRGGAVRLATPGDVLMVGEGIETCLAAIQETGHAAWAALSTSGLRSLNLPTEVRDVIVLADGDDPGESAARDCGLRWKREGRRVRIARPPRGLYFNDLLRGNSHCKSGSAA
jgi:putative DNA primase/helicase